MDPNPRICSTTAILVTCKFVIFISIFVDRQLEPASLYKRGDHVAVLLFTSLRINFLLTVAPSIHTGKQLLSLLAHDLASENGRNILRKNAFALMRLTRYKHAAATFLCSEPPMTKEACSILCKQCEGMKHPSPIMRLIRSILLMTILHHEGCSRLKTFF